VTGRFHRDRVFTAVAKAWFGTSTPRLLSPGQLAGANLLTDQVLELFQTTRPQAPAPRLFELVRSEDPSGVSGTGVVALGVEWPDGTVALHWPGDNPSTAVWGSVDAVLAIHGHAGLTVVRWLHEPLTRKDPS
jgi:hypothetical protein